MKPIRIAELLGISRQALSYELKKGKYQRLVDWMFVDSYSADIAQQKTDFEASSKGPQLKLGKDFELLNNLEKLLSDDYSPKAAVAQLRKFGKLSTDIGWRTVYNYIYAGIISGKHIYKSKKKKPALREQKQPRHGVSIDLRPGVINSRISFGHWEGDSVLGKREKGETLFVLTERKTRQNIVLRSHKLAYETSDAFLNLKKQCPEIFKSITFDNGSEFSCFDQIERTGTDVYFCHPYSSWERGSNEKQNQMIRRKIKKGTRIENYSDAQIQAVQTWLNNYPREIFGWRSSADLFAEECAKIGIDVKKIKFFE